MQIETEVDHHYRGEPPSRSDPDWALAILAGRQHGVVSIGQLHRLGFSRGMIERRILKGRLIPIYRGVYAVGHRALTPRGQIMAATLTVDEGALASHHAAAFLLAIISTPPKTIDITKPGSRRNRRNLRFHDSTVPVAERMTRDGIALTRPPRTIIDLAAVSSRGTLERLIHQCQTLRLCKPPQIHAAAEVRGQFRGRRLLFSILGEEGEGFATRSGLEDRFIRFLRRYGLELPETNVVVDTHVGPLEVDCRWEGFRLIVELDTPRYHGTRYARERDMRRDRALTALGYLVLRISDRQLEQPEALAEDLRRTMRNRADQLLTPNRDGG